MSFTIASIINSYRGEDPQFLKNNSRKLILDSVITTIVGIAAGLILGHVIQTDVLDFKAVWGIAGGVGGSFVIDLLALGHAQSKDCSIQYSEITEEEEAGIYDINAYHNDQLLKEWVSFRKKGYKSTDKAKFHISIARDKENLTNAFNVIYPILVKHKICLFKIAPVEKIVSDDPNPIGKEFTIYIQEEDSQEKNPDFWSKLLKEIVSALESAAVKPGTHPSGDMPIKGGKGFVYARSPNNILGNYISATTLKENGFSYREAAYLSPSPWVDLVIDESDKGETDKIKEINLPEKLELPNLNEQEAIYQTFTNDLLQKNTLAYFIKGNKRDMSFQEFDCMSTLFEKRYSSLKQPIQLILMRAARLTAALRSLLNIKAPVGHILPAINRSYLIPHVSENATNGNQLVKDIALCALRERREFPEEIQISDQDLDRLINLIQL